MAMRDSKSKEAYIGKFSFPRLPEVTIDSMLVL